MGTRQYNYIFSRLVGEIPTDPSQPQNVLGLLAYGIYKQEKIAYIEAFKRKHEGNDPEEHELDEFHTQSEARIAQYLRDAERQLSDFTDDIIKENLEDFKKAAKDGQKQALTELTQGQAQGFASTISQLKPGVWKSIWNWCASGLIGNAFFLLVIAGTLSLASCWVSDPVGRLIKGVTIEQPAQPNTMQPPVTVSPTNK